MVDYLAEWLVQKMAENWVDLKEMNWVVRMVECLVGSLAENLADPKECYLVVQKVAPKAD